MIFTHQVVLHFIMQLGEVWGCVRCQNIFLLIFIFFLYSLDNFYLIIKIIPVHCGNLKHSKGIKCISSVAQSYPTLCNSMDCSMPGFPVHHQLLELAQTLVHWVGDVIQPSYPLLSPSPSAFNLSQHKGLFQWVSSSHQVAKVLEFQLQHQSFQ